MIVFNPITKAFIRLRLILSLSALIYKKTKKLRTTLQLLSGLQTKVKNALGDDIMFKIARVNHKYYWRFAAPGFPSKKLRILQQNEIDRLISGSGMGNLQSVFFAITHKCPLNCQHCFEWENLNKPDKLSVEEIIHIVHKYQDAGVTQFLLSGGEPMLRCNDIEIILEQAKANSDFWIYSSGLNFNLKTAQTLKQKGLTGILISLDHFIESEHNNFRGHPDIFKLAKKAITYANQVGLVTALSLSATRNFVSQTNLENYMNLAKKLKVTFVQINEIQDVGKSNGKNMTLIAEQKEILEQIYKKYNGHKKYKSFPIIQYPAYHQRKVGCFGAGSRYIYIDASGQVHKCPFCTSHKINALDKSAQAAILQLQQEACPNFSRTKL